MKKSTAKATANEVLKVEVLTVTVETLKADLLGLKSSFDSAEKLGANFLINTINASLNNDDLKTLFEECKKILAESYAKKMCGAINIAYKLGVKHDAEKMTILSTKGFNNLYTQLREWKSNKKEITDSKQSIKTKGEKVTQKMTDKAGAINSKNHLEMAIVKSASLADVYDLLTSLGEMATAQKDNSKVLNFLATALLNIENEAYEMTA